MSRAVSRNQAGATGVHPLRIVDFRVGPHGRRIGLSVLHDLDRVLDQLESEFGDEPTTALVLRVGTSVGDDTDLDLEEIRSLPDDPARRVWAQEGQRVLRRIETLELPTVAAMEGRCFSGSLQLALACEVRIATDTGGTRIGLPEVRLGILPGWGGLVRLSRLVGVGDALDLLLTASDVPAERAMALSLVDQVCVQDELIERAVALVTNARARSSRAGRRGITARMIEETAPGRRVLYSAARRKHAIRRIVPDEAADRIVRTVSETVGVPLEQSFVIEAEGFAETLGAPAVRGTLHSHLLIAREARHLPDRAFTRAGNGSLAGHAAVLGGGVRGAFYSDLLISSGFAVMLKDVSGEAGRRSAGLVRARLAWAAGRNTIRTDEVETRMERLSSASGFGGFGRVEVVFEAAVEDAESKIGLLREAERHVREDCLLVSTSAIVPLRAVSPSLSDPTRFVGLHLLPITGALAPAEVVCGECTSRGAVDRAVELARALGRVPILVSDVPGLVLPRLTIAYIAAAEELVSAGTSASAVDDAMREFGMPVGPLELAELLGRGALEKSARALSAEFGERFLLRRMPPDPEPGESRFTGTWFPRLRRLAAHRRSSDRPVGGDSPDSSWTPARVQLRLLLTLLNEAARILEEGVVSSASEIDLAVLLGLGFPRDRGGLLYWADKTGTRRVRELSEQARPASPRLHSPPILIRMAEADGRFYEIADRVAVSDEPAPHGEPPGPRRSLDRASVGR
jgi:3-hydroxyacyl-CoA dehydrogenase/enoyl-CoA hydratase/carnithine racemase